ncbi:hypothetical protein [Embleya scabrispora]|uniref:hypothetical protein n=1 Tax=Embleya scabrispora TaxID=159449 RepID=UPI001F213B94|nr:hypothetical protein [Embleya scabrispora]
MATSLVDDEGVDLVFHRRGSSATLAVQVKARMSTGVQVRQGRLMAFVRSQTFRPRADLDMLFVAVDVELGAITTAWLVPSPEFAKMVTEPNSKGKFGFSASMKPQAKDRWTPFRLTAAELPKRILIDLPRRRRSRASRWDRPPVYPSRGGRSGGDDEPAHEPGPCLRSRPSGSGARCEGEAVERSGVVGGPVVG